jgi:type I restriction-modification system DNA methylase subunit
MAIKKSDLYSSLWASCDELRGGMDASQYKDYVLFMLFIKYISDKYGDSDDFAPPVVIPKGASFKDMVALKGKNDIGDKINTQVIQPLIDANSRIARSDFPDFNDSTKLGDGAQKVEKLGNLIAIFENPALDFSKNRAENDDILGDAYEYLMRHFATESGKIADPKNDYNLNLPRYIDSTEPEDLQDIDGHLRGGIPERDLDALGNYWKIMPGLRAALFEKFNRPGYSELKLPIAGVKHAIFGHAEFTPASCPQGNRI